MHKTHWREDSTSPQANLRTVSFTERTTWVVISSFICLIPPCLWHSTAHWRHQPSGTGARALSTSNNLVFFFFTSELYQVWRKSLASNIFRILCTTVIQISSFFIVFKKAIGFFWITMQMYIVSLIICMWLNLFSRRFVLLLAPNPGDATVTAKTQLTFCARYRPINEREH